MLLSLVLFFEKEAPATVTLSFRRFHFRSRLASILAAILRRCFFATFHATPLFLIAAIDMPSARLSFRFFRYFFTIDIRVSLILSAFSDIAGFLFINDTPAYASFSR